MFPPNEIVRDYVFLKAPFLTSRKIFEADLASRISNIRRTGVPECCFRWVSEQILFADYPIIFRPDFRSPGMLQPIFEIGDWQYYFPFFSPKGNSAHIAFKCETDAILARLTYPELGEAINILDQNVPSVY